MTLRLTLAAALAAFVLAASASSAQAKNPLSTLPSWSSFGGKLTSYTGYYNRTADEDAGPPAGHDVQFDEDFVPRGPHFDCDDCYYDIRLTARLSWVHMWRSRPASAEIVRSPGGDPLLDAGDFNFGDSPGADASFIFHRGCGRSFEVRYLWIDSHQAQRDVDMPVGTSTFRTTPPSDFVLGAPLTAEWDYFSNFQSVEVNLRRDCGRATVGLGFRYVDFSERFRGFHELGPITELLTWNTQNNLYGAQLTGDMLVLQTSRGLHIDAVGRAGIFYNDINTRFDNVRSVAGDSFARASRDEVAFLGELGVFGTYQLTSHLALRGGYQMMWLSGVAVAGDQVAETGHFNVAGEIASSASAGGSVFYHGLNLGAEVTW